MMSGLDDTEHAKNADAMISYQDETEHAKNPDAMISYEDDTDHAKNAPSRTSSNVFSDSHTVHSVILTSGDVEYDDATASFRPGLARTRHSKKQKTKSSLSVFNVLVDQEDDPLVMVHLPDRFDSGSMKSVLGWFGRMCLAGVGMFVEAYIVITTGQIKTVWRSQYPECWIPDEDQHCPRNIDCCCLFPNTPDDLIPDTEICEVSGAFPDKLLCSERNNHAVSYAEFAGIMAGMLVIGAICDIIGRKNAGVVTSLLMLLGITVMTYVKADDISTQFAVWSSFFAVFGFGVGGEYPLTASGAAEKQFELVDDAKLDDFERRQRRVELDHTITVRRGETISLVFSMQGVGAFLGSVVLLSLIYFGVQGTISCSDLSSNSTGNNPDALNGIWRSFYFIGVLMILLLLIYRFLVVEESKSFQDVQRRKKMREDRQKVLEKKTRLDIIRFYGPRLTGTSGCWFLWDIGFYGLKLFSGPIFQAINPDGDLYVTNGWLLFNNFCALLGYYAAAYVIDRPRVGRKRLQMFSFLMCAILFMISAIIFNTAPAGVIMFLFFASSFFGNFGANVTTYVMAAEAYPTELRSTCHGISAFSGKAGALLATVVFGFLDTTEIFAVTAGTCLLGLVFTYVFSCDLTHVSLAEHDAQLELFLEGRPDRYKGLLNKREHLTNFEVWTGWHGEFDELWAKKLVAEERSKHDGSFGDSFSMRNSMKTLVDKKE